MGDICGWAMKGYEKGQCSSLNRTGMGKLQRDQTEVFIL